MINDKTEELIRQAYMDDQLSVEEVIDFEGKLCRSDKIAIAKDKHFEDSLKLFLARESECPDSVWNEVKIRIVLQSNSWFNRVRFKIVSFRFAAAAGLVIALIGTIATRTGPVLNTTQDKFPIEFSDSLPHFSQPATIRGNHETIRDNLFDNGFHINFEKPKENSHHSIELLGLRYIRVNDETVAQIYFSCCLRPVTVLLSRNPRLLPENNIQIENSFKTMFHVSKETESYRIFIVGPHPPTYILDLFT